MMFLLISHRGNPIVNNYQKESFSAWLICIAAGFYFFYSFLELNLLNSISQQLILTWHINAKQLSYLSVISLIASAIFFIPMGYLLDKYSIKNIMLISMIICITATIQFAISATYLQAVIARFFIGTGYTVALLGCIRLITQWLKHQFALAFGMVTTIGLLGGIFAQTPIVKLNYMFGWRNAVLITAMMGLVILCINCFFIKAQPISSDHNALLRRDNITVVTKHILLNKYNWLCFFYSCLLNSPILFMGDLWGNIYLVARYHISSGQASYIISHLFIGMIIGCPLFGWLSDYYNNRTKIMLINACLLVLLVPLMFLNPGFSIHLLLILFFCCGMLTTSQALSYPIIIKSNHPELIGLASGLVTTLIMFGNGMLQSIFGFLIDSSSQVQQLHISSTLLSIHLVVIISFFYIICISIAIYFIKLSNEGKQNTVAQRATDQ